MIRSLQSVVGVVILGLLACWPAPVMAAPLQQLSSSSGEVRDLLRINTTVLFAATQGGGVHKSTDGGTSWTRLSGLSARYVWRLAGDPANGQVVYAATEGGLFKTVDGGTTWSQKTFDGVRAIAVDPANANHLLIGVPGMGVSTSTDGGTTFAPSNTGLDSVDVTAIAFDQVTAGLVYVGLSSKPGASWGGVFRSVNGGATWSNWNNPGGGALGNLFVTALVVEDDGTVHVGTFNPATNGGGLYRRTPTGGWSLRLEAYGIEALILDESSSFTLWAGTRFFGPWVTQNNGTTWSQAVNPGTDPEVYTGVYALLTFPGTPGKVLAGVKGLGLYLSLNTGGAWDRVSPGLRADRARAIIAAPGSPNTLYLGLDGGGVMRSVDGGSTWTTFNTGLEVPGVERALTITNLAISSTNPATIYAATMGRGLFRWNGGSSTWVQVSESGLPSTGYLKTMGLAVNAADDRTVYASFFDPGQGVYRRNTNGSWNLVLPGPSSGAGASKIVTSPTSTTRLYALMFGGPPYRSTNGGASWTPVTATHAGFMGLSFYAVAENPLNPNVALASTNKGLFLSVDGGNSWANLGVSATLGSTVLTGLVFSPTVDNRVWAVDRGGGYYCSNDGGTSWQALADPLLGRAVVDLTLINGALYLVTDGSGVLRDPAPTCP